MKHKIKYLWTILFLLISIFAYSQETDIRTRLFGNHYLTAIVNYARSSIDLKNFFREREVLEWGGLYDYNASDWWGAGIRYSIGTKLGPLSFDISSSNISKKVNLYFSIGHYF